MSTDTEGQPVRMTDMAFRLKRRWRLLLAAVLVTTIALIALGLNVPERYTATSTLVVAPLVSDPGISQNPSTIDIDTEREIVRSTEVVELASAELGDPDLRSTLLANTEVAAPSGTQLLRVSVTADDPESAARYSVAMADAYLAFRQERAAESAERYIEAIDDEIAAINASGSAEAQRWVNTLLERRQSAALLRFYPGRIIGPAVPPSSPSSLGLPAFVAAGVVGGLLIGLALVLIRDRTDRRVRFSSQFAELTQSSPLVLNTAQDTEGLRWLIREVDSVKAPDELPRLIGVITVGKPSTPGFARAVADALEASGRLVVRVDASARDPRTIDLGWPTPRFKEESWASATAVIDLDAVESWTTVARLAERCDVVVVVGTPKTSTPRLRATWNVLMNAAPALIPVFLAPRRHWRRSILPTPTTAAPAPAGAPSRTASAVTVPDREHGAGRAPYDADDEDRGPVSAGSVVQTSRRGRESG